LPGAGWYSTANTPYESWKILFWAGLVITVIGGLFAYFVHAVFVAGDCNPCPPPPIWFILPLLIGLVTLTAGILLSLTKHTTERPGVTQPKNQGEG